jgi:MoaA/NifB/PqqE/SkfB family radical SAM enzyme
VQAKGLSPVCNLRCSFKWLPLKNDFSQKEQAKDLSLSDLICALKYNHTVIKKQGTYYKTNTVVCSGGDALSHRRLVF